MFQTVNVKISWSLLTFCKWTHAVVVRVHLHLFCWKLISSQQCSTLSAGLNIRGEKFHRILKCKLTISGSQGPSVQSPKLLGVFWGEVSTHLPYGECQMYSFLTHLFYFLELWWQILHQGDCCWPAWSTGKGELFACRNLCRHTFCTRVYVLKSS